VTTSQPGLRGRRIMVVEDEAPIAAVLEDLLMANGVEVVGAYPSIKAAMVALGHEPMPDAALLDISVQGRPVFPPARRLVGMGAPILFLTGFGAAALPPAPADRPVVARPYRDEMLLSVLAGAMARRPQAVAAPCVGPLAG